MELQDSDPKNLSTIQEFPSSIIDAQKEVRETEISNEESKDSNRQTQSGNLMQSMVKTIRKNARSFTFCVKIIIRFLSILPIHDDLLFIR